MRVKRPQFSRIFGSHRSSDPRVGVFVDGPNVFRDEFDVDLDDIRVAGRSLGRLSITRLYLDEHATPGLIQAAEARGFEVIVTSGDVDVKLAVEAVETALTDSMDVLAVVSRDTDFKPLLEIAAVHGIDTVVITPGDHGRSDALVNAAQTTISLADRETEPSQCR